MIGAAWLREMSLACAGAAVIAFGIAVLDGGGPRRVPAAHATPAQGESPEPSPPAEGDRPRGDGEVTDEPPVLNGNGTLNVVPGGSPVLGTGRPMRFIVEVEDGLQVDGEAFAARVEEVLGSPRGWSPVDGVSFQRVDTGDADFRVALVGPETTDELCAPLQTNGIFSCEMGGRAVLNYRRWIEGADAYGDDLIHYRIYMINHEVGHALGHGHAACPAAGELAPIMVQQTKGVGECRPNPWPAP